MIRARDVRNIGGMNDGNENQRNAANAIRYGTVMAVDGKKCRVKSGGVESDFVPWFVPAAGEAVAWSVPSVGEQGLLFSPEGDTGGAVFLRGLYSTAFESDETSADVEAFRMRDGAVIRYDSASHALSATLPEGGTFEITANGGGTVNGPLTVNGKLTVSDDADIGGTMTAVTDAIGGGKSLKNHRHTGVQSGGSVTGPPQ